MRLQKLIFLTFFLFFSVSVFSQNEKLIESLERQLKSVADDAKPELLNRLATIYQSSNPDKAIEYSDKALSLAKKYKKREEEAKANHILAAVYYNKKDYKKSLKYFEGELSIRETSGARIDLALTYFNIGSLSRQADKDKKATEYFEKSLQIAKEQKNQALIEKNYNILFEVNYQLKKYDKALEYFKLLIKCKDSTFNVEKVNQIQVLERQIQSVQTEKEQKVKELKNKNVALQQKDQALQNKEEILQSKEEMLQRKDSTIVIVNQEKETLLVNSAQKDLTIIELNYKNAYKESIIQQQEMQRRYFIYGVVFLCIIILLIFFMYRLKRRANKRLAAQNEQIRLQKEEIETQRDNLATFNQQLEQQKEEIIAQRDEIEDKNTFLSNAYRLIEDKNNSITSSIRYAQRIQSALLPPSEYITKILPQHFVLYKPRDIVSGDFYFFKKFTITIFGTKKDLVLIAAVDCTGHGVPGAFMSMLGMTYLNEIVGKENYLHPNLILDELRNHVKSALRQHGENTISQDGMDIALCTIDLQTKAIEYAGANNPLLIIRNNEIIQIKADRQPIGVFPKEHPFTNHQEQLQSGDVLYLFSDGYLDQIGGERNKKLMSKGFHQLLLDNHKKSMSEQHKELDKYIEIWKGDNEQVDDIMIIGFKV